MSMPLRLLTGILIGLFSAGPVMAYESADKAKDGIAAYGRGDYATAVKLWEPPADHGDAISQTSLGYMYDAGKGVPRDYVKAVKWYRLAAEQGEIMAQNNLGRMYELGHGVPQDYAEAVKWYRLAAERGFGQAQSDLGRMYAFGYGVAQDYVQAHMWFNLAAAEKEVDAVHYRDVVAAKMTPDQIAEAQRLAREWKPKKER